MEQHVIIGAGALGRAVARELASHGRPVRLLSRSGPAPMPGVETGRVDAADPAALDAALAGATVVYQCSQPAYTRWPQEFPALQHGILEATVRAGADLVLVDNLYSYGDTDGAVITEQTPENPASRKGRVRQQMARDALEAHRLGRLRVAIARPSDFFGPGHDQTSRPVFGAAVRGKALQVLGSADQPHSFSFVPDAGRALAALGTSTPGWGSIWIAPVQPALTQREFGQRVWDAAGQSGAVRLAVAGRRTLRALGLVVPVVREVVEMLYEFEKPFVVDSSRFESTFGITPTPLDEAIERTVVAYREALVRR